MNGGETNRLRVLVVDDEPGGRALAAHELRKEFEEFELIEIGEPRELAEAIEKGGFELVVTDYQLGWTDGLAVLQAVKRKYPDCPVVMFTGAVSEEFAVQAMKAGFDDYVLKSSQRFGGLKAAARTALDDAQRRRAQREAEVRHREFFDGVPVGMYRASVDGRILTANPAAAQILGSPDCESLIGLNVASLYADSAERGARLELGRPGVAEERELRFRRLDGRIIWVVNNARMTCDAAGNVLYSEAAIQDVTVRKQAE
ncbi:MAG: hypothetical protein QOD06_1905, partial [Candidatus Binatota bacterium]|nr:hypothetical protein [Candidatus Binatota bacterium]